MNGKKNVRILPETVELIVKKHPKLVRESFAYAVHVLLHEKLGADPPLTPRELMGQGASKRMAKVDTPRRAYQRQKKTESRKRQRE